jgi:(1->4)-alpha-D-glucan 1-alpha-D-glucosylmutase
VDRIKQYLVKALREAKESTSWHDPDTDYESFLEALVEQLLNETWGSGLGDEIAAYAGTLAWHGALNSLAQTLLKITCPGVPDFYQGTELWSLTLVDPDNRRPVDFAERRSLLQSLEPTLENPTPAGVQQLVENWRTGAIKLYLTALALRYRRARARLFRQGRYLPLQVTGGRSSHLVAFARDDGEHSAIIIVPRLLARLCRPGELPGPAAWEDTAIALPAAWQHRPVRNVLTGETTKTRGGIEARELLVTLPLALLE